MNFDEYVWRNKLTLKKVSDETGVCYNTLIEIRANKRSPRLETALILHKFSGEQIDLIEMVEKGKVEQLKKSMSVAEIKGNLCREYHGNDTKTAAI